MRQLTRQDVIHAFATLGVKLGGTVQRAHYDDAKTQALAGVRSLQIQSHPDKHSASSDGKRATVRFQEISAAEHLVRSNEWFSVAHLFAGAGQGSATERWSSQWGGWPGGVPRPTTRPGTRYYARCPVCGVLVADGERHSCRIPVDHFKTKSKPFSYERPWKSSPENPAGRPVEEKPPHPPECGNESPLGVRCTQPHAHEGWHRGYGKKGRHTWRETSRSTEEKVRVEKTRRGT